VVLPEPVRLQARQALRALPLQQVPSVRRQGLPWTAGPRQEDR